MPSDGSGFTQTNRTSTTQIKKIAPTTILAGKTEKPKTQSTISPEIRRK
ncbi:hypothetical protein COLO4_05087 [Corchorus olitorius]|uniref:Uncharacterized protein n=1 Tax=Corchorus olitorius TaxID=93759 RepID=A0A1R3KS28_9ROSI|nr:hypothetical protein COLO4_05087 [Corchorus olitorius]